MIPQSRDIGKEFLQFTIISHQNQLFCFCFFLLEASLYDKGVPARRDEKKKGTVPWCWKHILSNMTSGVLFREIEEKDFLEIKALHRECFPVQYEDSFFRNACKRLGVRKTPLVSVIAVECESSKVIGCILAQFNKVGKIEDKNLFADSYEPAREVLYILTLGLTQEYRRSGLGTRLLQFTLDIARNNVSCGAIYLHVIHYNEAAIRFYERNDFMFFRSLDEFYSIGESYFMAYLVTTSSTDNF